MTKNIPPLRSIVAGVGALLALTFSNTHGAPTARTNVLVIVVDDLNDWVGTLGGHAQAHTPHLDDLARQGMLFTNAHCQAPVCTASRASLVTGCLPSTLGLYFLRPFLAASAAAREKPTIAEHFASAGYTTMGVGKFYGDSRERHYFQQYGGPLGGFGPLPKEKLNYPTGVKLWDWGAHPSSDDQMPDSKIADWAIERIESSYDQPFFLAVGFWRPHVPMYAPTRWFDGFPIETVQTPATMPNDRDDLSPYAKQLTFGQPAPRHDWFLRHPGQWAKAVQAYLACTSFVDHSAGRVLKALKESGHAKNTLVVFLSDHGFHLGEKERWAKRSLWEESTRVPLIFAGPGIEAGKRCDKPVGLVDVFATLADRCDLPHVAGQDGQSLAPLLEDPNARWERPALTTFGPGNHAARSTRWRYIRYADGSEELYDHQIDPHEWNNLATDPSLAPIKAAHAKWLPSREQPAVPSEGSSGYRDFVKAEQLGVAP